MKIIKSTRFIALALTSLIGIGLLAPIPAFADNATSDVCSLQGDDEAVAELKKASGCPDSGTPASLESVVKNILLAIIGVLGIVAVVFVIVGGIQYMTSAGDPSKVEKAKKTILYALIGLAVAALAFVIVQFAINTVADA